MSPAGEAGFKRQGLLGGLLGGDDDKPSSTSNGPNADAGPTPTPTTSGGGGLLGGLGSAIGGLTSGLGGLGQSTSGSTVPPTSTSALTSSTVSSRSSSSTSSTPTTSGSTSTQPTSTPSSSVSTSGTSPSVSTPAPVSQSEATTTFVSTSDNRVYTITLTSSAVPSETSEAGVTQNGASSKSFLENKPLSGTVFALVGLVGLVIIIMLSTWFLRRSRRNRLEREAEMFPDDTWTSTDALTGNEKVDLARTPSNRTAHSKGSGGYGHRQQLSDGTLRQSPPPQLPQVLLPGQGMGMNGFNSLPAASGLSGPGGAWAPPPMQPQAYGYEGPYATYQQTTYRPTLPSQVQAQQQGFGSGQPQPRVLAMPQQQAQRRILPGSNQSPTSNQGPPFVFGHNKSNSGGSSSGTVLTAGAGGSHAQEAAARASTGSDAYADYAFATGPGYQASQPRNLTIANA